MTNVPPLPPPLPAVNTNHRSAFSIHQNKINTVESYDDCKCLCNLDMIEKKAITKVKPIAQSGPNCGIAALAMIASLTPNCPSVENIFNEAKLRGFTNNGEMFSACNMKVLTDAVVSPWFETEFFCDGLSTNKSYVVDRLFRGDLALVPYDADRDHSPCCKEGHKAHWALLCGAVTDMTGCVHVVARHGKSRHMAAWPYERLQRSNDNLTHLDPERVSDGRDYILPEGGVRAGLANQFIMVRQRTL